ncbi:MAG: hypothetical protein J6X26_00895 [Bacteroidales bacterium]|nr:hypothetical protein [Bacteroidales bacterium]
MTNEEKARELAMEYCKELDDEGRTSYNIFCEEACIEMAKWKDEQYNRDVRSAIEKAVEVGKHQMKRRIQCSIDVMELLMKNEKVENSERFDLVVKFIDSLRKELETL